jgi:hypothetical protein
MAIGQPLNQTPRELLGVPIRGRGDWRLDTTCLRGVLN